MEVPLLEVRIRVIDGLTKHPRDAPMLLSVLHRKVRSERKTHDEMLLTYPRRWEMPPKPSSPGSPEASRAAARLRRSESIGSRSRATTKEAKRGESGHP